MNLQLPETNDVAIFTGTHGTDIDREKALKTFLVGRRYIVEEVKISHWSTIIRLEGIQGWWNSVLFEYIK